MSDYVGQRAIHHNGEGVSLPATITAYRDTGFVDVTVHGDTDVEVCNEIFIVSGDFDGRHVSLFNPFDKPAEELAPPESGIETGTAVIVVDTAGTAVVTNPPAVDPVTGTATTTTTTTEGA